MNDPFRITGPTCISFSGGRTSGYMLWRVLQANGGLPDDARVCFANTGREDEATLRFVGDCAEQWGVPITWLEYTGEDALASLGIPVGYGGMRRAVLSLADSMR